MKGEVSSGKRGKDEDFKVGEDAVVGVANTKKRAALGDISNKQPRADEAAGTKNPKVSSDGKALAAVTRGMAAAMAGPLSHTEATMQLQRSASARATSGSNPATLRFSEPMEAEAGQTTDGDGCGAESQIQLWKDVDAQHANDHLFCTQYVNDIYAHLRESEGKHRPNTTYMETLQRDINSTMRGILVDWLVEVAEEYHLVSDTLFLSVNYIDRCLSKYVCVRSMLQLVGVTCMLIAAKYEEIYAPPVDDFCYITDNTYTHEQVLEMERKILEVLNFELVTPTTKTFVRRFLRAAEVESGSKVEFFAYYLSELTLLDYSFLKFHPSLAAASIVLLSLFTVQRTGWTPTLEHYVGYKPSELQECTQAVNELFVGSKKSTLPAIRE
eukprot:gene10245-12119_t